MNDLLYKARHLFRWVTGRRAEITAHGPRVWVNDAATGQNLGRFGPAGVEVHNGVLLLAVFVPGTSVASWRQFQESMWEFHRVVVGDSYMPLGLK